jgi:UDPglucose 6-dehydrogenase
MTDPDLPSHPDLTARIAIVGVGYVGLTTAVCLAQLGHTVVCGDSDAAKVELLSRGEPTFVEDGLKELLHSGLASRRLKFVVTASAAVEDAEFVFICVPTPERSDGSPDVTALESVATEIGPCLAHGAIVVNKSTVPVGSTVLVERLLGRNDIAVVSNPEFLREGSAIKDCLSPARIVVGGKDPIATAQVGRLLSLAGAPLIVTDAATAEMIKYASNVFLATKLSLVNAVADLCDRLGADAHDVFLGIGHDTRIGFDHLQPGPGWGGSCLPKDTRALVFMAKQANFAFPLLDEVLRSNEIHLASVVTKIRQACEGVLAGTVVAAWGLTFKAGTDDRRQSPALEVLRQVNGEGGRVKAFDPTTVGEPVPELPDSILITDDPYSACDGAKVLVVLTEWPEFRLLDLDKVYQLMAAEPTIVDTRNLLDGARVRQVGFSYVGIGRR